MMNGNRNLYAEDVNFAALALQSPEFNKYLKLNGQLDFSNPDAVKQLTKSLLKRDFGIAIELPDDRLCPPVPNRFNYILWIQDLLDTTGENYTDRYDSERDVVGLDIGTGASCIYPLLGCAQRVKWRFAATDIDEKNMEYAKRNVAINSLKSRIRLLKTSPSDPLIPLDAFHLENITFTICNPPFYSSTTDLLARAAEKSRPPHSACTGAEIEMVTPGGEVAFVTRLITESLVLQDRVGWYTSMLGKYESVSSIVKTLKAKAVSNWAVTEFVQGSKTRRWAVAWSFGSFRPRMDVARGIASFPKHLLPFPSSYPVVIPSTTIGAVETNLNNILRSLDLRWQYRAAIATGIGFAQKNVWSRAARRSKGKGGESATREKMRDEAGDSSSDDGDDEEEPALGFKVQVSQEGEGGGVEVRIRWLRGRDSVLFESFCGMLVRQLRAL